MPDIVSNIGTLGVLLMARDKGLVAVLKPLLDNLRRAGFRMSDDLYDRVLDSAGESETVRMGSAVKMKL